MKSLKATLVATFVLAAFFFGGQPKTYAGESPFVDLSTLTKTDPNIYIDSVPSGAEVYLLPKDEKSTEKDKLLGKTPLVVKASDCASKKFWVSMNMENYLKQVADIPEMKDWIKSFKSDQYFSDGPMTKSDYFNFEVSVSRSVSSINGGLVSVGPVYDLEWPSANRICAFFVPKGQKASSFYPLMPPLGTFKGAIGDLRTSLQQRYRFSAEQTQEAIGCLSRCGKYLTKVNDPFKDNTAREYNIVIQGGSNENTIVTMSEIRVIPGYNDK